MSSLKTSRELIRSLSIPEQKVAKTILSALSSRGAESENLSLKLFDILLREVKANELFKETEIEKLLYDKYSEDAFPRLLLRFNEKLLEVFTLNVNIERKETYSDLGKNTHQIRKQLSQAQILDYRGVHGISANLFEDCIKRAKKFELFEELALAMRIRMEQCAQHNKPKRYKQLVSEYDIVLKKASLAKQAQTYFNDLTISFEYEGENISNEILKNRIIYLTKEQSIYGSNTSLFFLRFIEVHYYQMIGQYIAAGSKLQNQIKLIESSPALYNKERFMLAKLNLAWNELYTHQFKSSQKKASQVFSSLNDNHYLKIQCLLTEFWAFFYDGLYDSALEKLNEMDISDQGIEAEFRIGKRAYYRACIYFLQGRNKETGDILRNLNPIEKDDQSYNLWLRFLYIMNDIELELTENAFNRVNALRSHIAKLKEETRANHRIRLIYDILRALANNRFTFIQVKEKKGEELKKLNTSPEMRWEILSPELIIFTHWFEQRLYKNKSQQTIPDYWEPAQTA